MHLTLLASLLVTLLCCACVSEGANEGFAACLPEDVRLDEVVAAPLANATAGSDAKKVTVKATLTRLKARCEKDKLVDGAGREIRFYRLLGCWGNPPADYQEQLASQAAALEELRKKCTVVEISCAPLDPRQIQ
ncbi:MAG: hypothetical protein HY011_04590 [Acidobacteria bacterium]|nr:hypothetical protein [Acidobacteriota bacterium]